MKCKPTILSDKMKCSDTATSPIKMMRKPGLSFLALSIVDSLISLAYAAGEDDPAPLVADLYPSHKRNGYDEKMAVKVMDDDNRDIAIFILTQMLNTCRAIIIQGAEGKKMLPSVFKSMGLVAVLSQSLIDLRAVMSQALPAR